MVERKYTLATCHWCNQPSRVSKGGYEFCSEHLILYVLVHDFMESPMDQAEAQELAGVVLDDIRKRTLDGVILAYRRSEIEGIKHPVLN